MQLVGGELKNYKVLLALFCFVFYESIWGCGGGKGVGGWGGGAGMFIVAGEIPGPWPLVTIRKLNSFQR